MWAFGLYDSLIILLICTFKFASSTPGCHETGSGKNCHSSSEVNRNCNTVSAAIKAKCCYHGRWDSEVDGCY
ncbi:hypothetical protein PGTUg99_013527 [Puccinia graminis f. sp. tritici]|uniref:Uncharacterized protein n=1 Tax=Puccinia graminis f. sp. tritici TaxID=56615 RepID=A0A5B0SAQ7_PUCGR|nr:hypothetical protein PGTUg99_013527 [Puccinia graminis f. sp. tritici]